MTSLSSWRARLCHAGGRRSGRRRGSWRFKDLPLRTQVLLLVILPLVAWFSALGVFEHAAFATRRQLDATLAWYEHGIALKVLERAGDEYVESVGASLMPGDKSATGNHRAQKATELQQARLVALATSPSNSKVERRGERRVSDLVVELEGRGRAVGTDAQRFRALHDFYEGSVVPHLNEQMAQERSRRLAALSGQDRRCRLERVAGFAGVGVILAGILLFGTAYSERVSASVGRVRQALEEVAGGKLEGELPVTSRDEIGQLSASLDRAIDALRRQRTAQIAFHAGIVHEVRNPLSTLEAALDLLVSREPPPDTDTRMVLSIVERQVASLSRLIGDLLDAFEIEGGQLSLHPEPTDLKDLAENAVEAFAGVSVRHTIQLRVPEEPVVLGVDPMRIGQVLTNLLSNALKYSPRGGPVDVTVEKSATDVVLSVTDVGLGIDATVMPRIFEPFSRGEPTKHQIPGAGLGLAVCRRIVTAHGGTIEVDSAPGEGSTFRVRLPAT